MPDNIDDTCCILIGPPEKVLRLQLLLRELRIDSEVVDNATGTDLPPKGSSPVQLWVRREDAKNPDLIRAKQSVEAPRNPSPVDLPTDQTRTRFARGTTGLLWSGSGSASSNEPPRSEVEQDKGPLVLLPALPVAPMLMAAFWALLGSSVGIKLSQNVWPLLGGDGGAIGSTSIGETIGAIFGAILGWIANPRMLVLLMALFAGSHAGELVGWSLSREMGAVVGQIAGGVVGGLTWAIWLFGGHVQPRASSKVRE